MDCLDVTTEPPGRSDRSWCEAWLRTGCVGPKMVHLQAKVYFLISTYIAAYSISLQSWFRIALRISSPKSFPDNHLLATNSDVIGDLKHILDKESTDNHRLKPAVDGPAHQSSEFKIQSCCVHSPDNTEPESDCKKKLTFFFTLSIVTRMARPTKVVHIYDDQHKRAKKLAAARGISLEKLINACLCRGLDDAEKIEPHVLQGIFRRWTP